MSDTVPVTGARPEGPPPLRQLYFYLTEGCNLACRHCWLAPRFDPHGDRYPTLPVALFETAIAEAKPLGLQAVKLTGGEPLLHPHIGALLQIVRREGLGLTIETNGWLCTPEVAAQIAQSPDAFCSVSLDGADARTHDSVRGIPGSFERVQQAVRNLAAVGLAPQLVMSLMRCNAAQMQDVIRLAERCGAASVKFNIVQPTGRGERFKDDVQGLPIPELVDLGQRVELQWAPATSVALHFDWPLAFRPLSRLAAGKGAGACDVLHILGVLPSGHYALCGIGEHLPEMLFGRVGADPLVDVWNAHPMLAELRAGLPHRLGGVCARCLMRASCHGSCLAQNYYRARTLWAPFWFCDQAHQAGLFPASRLS